MTEVVLQCLMALERLIILFSNTRREMAKSKLHHDTIQAITLAKDKKNTSKIEEIFNPDKIKK